MFKFKNFEMKKMKVIKVKIHNFIDYALALALLISPWLFNMESGSMASKIIYTIGLCLLLNSFITKHKFGLTKMLCVNTHLKVDLFLAVFLAASPWLYGFQKSYVLPHMFIGLLIIANVLLTKIPKKKAKMNLI